jgi:ubiquinone/menaquinone biosynthesis C-methylase UbiE
MSIDPKQTYFDSVATRWDGWCDDDRARTWIRDRLASSGVTADELVVDLGCGTGTLVGELCAVLSSTARVIAVDFSERMLTCAREKVSDPRVTWVRAHAASLPIPYDGADRIICYSVWPHFDEPDMVAREAFRVLRPGGLLHVWHSSSRSRINAVHARAGGAIENDLMPPAGDLVLLLKCNGFSPVEVVDDDEQYLVSVRKPAVRSSM